MNRERKGLIGLLGLLAGVVLLTLGVVRSYNSGGADQLHTPRESTASPELIRALLNESARFFTQKRYPEAEHSLRRVLNLDRDNLVAMRMLGNVYFLSGRYFEASSVFRAVLAKQPKDPVAHANLGETLIRMQWYEAGIRELLTARAIDPDQPGINLSLSRAYEELGDSATAGQYRKLASEQAARQKNQRTADVPQKKEETIRTEPASVKFPEPNHESN
ncbi:tetratricopeptide repeat protein [uncultured Victivallis sp.]|uniref:tetratricopeptide repeat protein n=1 Tax=uncultured Victivallis sp. TaxID=354118 RepID=UPI0025DE12F0|nr:tetratricopeptide repeat protein [uncultured Victivallis sp.]